ncbi:alpha-L-rhamnosidase [Qingshengfaniella alkalisoli]|uniref:alpha-L-rhamnosidase n=1 Tax=Qingshengfaniella alkalisoli TaxID=2599296 RepID=A0A5B8J1E8_9RHOB|nr:alpha-L-rhamnosidase [Qingshengfaniella alkalisoli]QDY71011.1 Bacterial alpha-L-rhamnosidase [Qingshengfaniella alkalisoli]
MEDVRLASDAAEMLQRRSWDAKVISPDVDEGVGRRASFVAGSFTLPAGSRPMLYISAQGLYRAFVNGKRVGNDCLTPGWTCYDNRIAFQTYDISDLAQEGENRIEIWLGDGWFRSPLMWREYAIPNGWGDRIGAIAEIVDGGATVCATGPDWQSGLLPVTKSGIYYGEDYDAGLKPEISGSVEVLETDTALFVAHEAEAVKELDSLKPVGSWTVGDAVIYDFGQNVAGYTRIRVKGAAGAKVYIDFAEVLGPNGEFDNRNYRVARAALSYTLSGDGEECWAPMFTFMGYRYARVTIEGDTELLDIVSVPISSVPDVAGGFECDVAAVNRLVLNTIWSQRGNFIEIPTDCPQRDERLGWTGDAQVFAGTACWLADSERFLRKYLRDVMHDQRDDGGVPHFTPDPTRRPGSKFTGDWAGSTGWGDVITVMPWQLYLHYGREDVLRECFPAMLKWLDYLWSISDGPIIHPHSSWGQKGFTFGDWLQPVGDNRKPRPTIADDCAATLYFAISTDLAAKIARVIGETAEAEKLEANAKVIRDAFAREYFSASGRMAHNDQTSYALAFLYDLVPVEHFEAAKGYFRRVIVDAKHKIGTGFIGTPALLPALSKLGMNDLAEKVFLNRKVPGWLYQVDRGATTIWERWDAIGEDGTIYEPLMNSYNHYAYGAVCQWLFENVAGVQPMEDAPGFDRVRLAPTVLPELGKVTMWHDCRHGRVEASWVLANGRATYRVTLPEGCEGVLPADIYNGVTIDGETALVPPEGLTLSSGTHEIGFDI